ncbi:hypothetical protein [Candidatus Poriferisodalis sp.]|uniref:hypothetical protein n=1 Tax=Candidatus Poriferisodalis sp. TaxID=3101277 RepID=UPI003B010B49
MSYAAAGLLADAHTAVPSEAVGSGLAMWWLAVMLLGMSTVAFGTGFVLYLRRTASHRAQLPTSPTEPSPSVQNEGDP